MLTEGIFLLVLLCHSPKWQDLSQATLSSVSIAVATL